MTKVGDAPLQATAEFQQLQGAAAQANTSLQTATGGFGGVTKEVQATKMEVHALTNLMMVFGLQRCPQVTMAVTGVAYGFRGIKLAADAAKASVVAVTAEFAVILAGLYAIMRAYEEAVKMFAAQKEEAASLTAVWAAQDAEAARLRKEIEALAKAHKISAEAAIYWTESLQSGAPWLNQMAAAYVAEKKAIADVQKVSHEAWLETLDDKSRELEKIGDVRTKRLQALEDLKKYYAGDAAVMAAIAKAEENIGAAYDMAATKILTVTVTAPAAIQTFTELELAGRHAIEEFASGFSHTLVEGIRTGHMEMGKFFGDFMAMAAQMLIQLQMMSMFRSIFPSLFPVAAAVLAGGGVRFAAGGLPGVFEASRPTYIPKFNVMAGEAGREMLTVLAHPKRMQLGGIEAIVGDAGANKLAVARAGDVARAGGTIVIEVRHSEMAEARIVENSVSGSVARVTRDLTRHTPLRTAARSASS